MFSPFSIYSIGPPDIDPDLSSFLYLCDKVTSTNLVVIPKKAVTHIQNNAAGPPMKIAIATPPIFPVPTVPERAVLNAWNGLV